MQLVFNDFPAYILMKKKEGVKTFAAHKAIITPPNSEVIIVHSGQIGQGDNSCWVSVLEKHKDFSTPIFSVSSASFGDIIDSWGEHLIALTKKYDVVKTCNVSNKVFGRGFAPISYKTVSEIAASKDKEYIYVRGENGVWDYCSTPPHITATPYVISHNYGEIETRGHNFLLKDISAGTVKGVLAFECVGDVSKGGYLGTEAYTAIGLIISKLNCEDLTTLMFNANVPVLSACVASGENSIRIQKISQTLFAIEIDVLARGT